MAKSKIKVGEKQSAQSATSLSSKDLITAYKNILRARLTDAKAITLYKQNKSAFQIGCAGHEAVGVAAAAVFKSGKDWFYPYYRDMALMLGLGMTEKELMLNIMSKADDPNSHGRMMPMHYGSKRLNVPQQSSPTGSQYLQAVGCAWAGRYLGTDDVVYVSSGDGACAQGDFHEAVNWAAIKKLPVVFVIQNNGYAISVPVEDCIAGGKLSELTSGYPNLLRLTVNGSDYPECFKTLTEAYEYSRSGKGPALLEAFVPRLQSHSISDNQSKYRSVEELKKDSERDPLLFIHELLVSKKVATLQELELVEAEIKTIIDAAADWAETQPDPALSSMLEHNFTDPEPQNLFREEKKTGEELYPIDAVNRALHEELVRDKKVVVFGEDVAYDKGGVFGATAGLTEAFGEERVFNTPLAESFIIGVSVGMATRGVKPVAEVQFADYIWTGMNQLRNELALMSYRSGGECKAPAVIRIPVGGYIRGGVYHSQNIEATFAHFPGLFIAYPSNAADAHGLLKAAIRMSDPVLFLEHKGLYRQVYAKGAVGSADSAIPFGRASIVQTGSDLTIVAWGAMVEKAKRAAEQLASSKVSVEIIDLRTIVPFDFEAVAHSVKKTGRVLIAQEDLSFVGFSAEIAARIAGECFTDLDAPIGRVGMKYVAGVPQAPALEIAVLPSVQDIVQLAERIVAF